MEEDVMKKSTASVGLLLLLGMLCLVSCAQT